MQQVFGLALLAVAFTLATPGKAGPWSLELSRLKNASVHYAEYSGLEKFPTPVISWRRPGLVGSEAELEQIKAKVIYPLVVESKKPISAVVVEFFPADRQSIGVLVLWADGEAGESMIAKNQKGQFDADAYKVFFAKPTP